MGKFCLLQPLSTKYNTTFASSRFSHLLRLPARGNSGAMMAHWLSLKSHAYLRLSFSCIMTLLYYAPLLVQLLRLARCAAAGGPGLRPCL